MDVVGRILRLATPAAKADFLPTLLGPLLEAVRSGRAALVLFGAGYTGTHLAHGFRIHGISPAAFCDNAPARVGGLCDGLPVLRPQELVTRYPGAIVLISVNAPTAPEIRTQLLALGVPEDRIVMPPTPFDPVVYYRNLSKWYWSEEDLRRHARSLQETYELLADPKSRELFLHRIALLAGGFDYLAFQRFIGTYPEFVSHTVPCLFTQPVFDENHFYFRSAFMPLEPGEVFVNGGALIGECAFEFAKACREKGLEYGEILNFEPDPRNFQELSRNVASLPRVRCFRYGLWSGRNRLHFASNLSSPVCAPGALSQDGTIEVEVIGLDELLPGAKITFIKMDIEGAELEALKGAAETIRRNRPKLAISVYHKRDDIFEIPLFIRDLYPGYKFYLRHHCTTFSETVLFAVA